MISLQITGLESIQNKLKQTGEPELYKKVMHDTGEIAYKWMRIFCPVDTGELLKSTFLKKTQGCDRTN